MQRDLGLNGNGTSGIINQLLSVENAKVAAVFIEKEDGKIDVGLRSRVGYDVSVIAARLGGGGHKQASGALIPRSVGGGTRTRIGGNQKIFGRQVET